MIKHGYPILFIVIISVLIISSGISNSNSELPKLISLAYNEAPPVKINEINDCFYRVAYPYSNISKINLPDKYDNLISKYENINIEVLPAGWAHDYVCPDHGKQLIPLSTNKHKCPTDGSIFEGPKFTAGYMNILHNNVADVVLASSIKYLRNKDARYLKTAENMILKYAVEYSDLPLHDYQGNFGTGASQRGARLFAQTLDEAVWSIKIAIAFDIIAPYISSSSKETIQSLLIDISKVIKRNDMMMSNWQAWHTAALGVIGIAIKDSKLVYDAIYGDRGYYYLLRNGTSHEGFWWDGSIGYHFYALNALNILAESAFVYGLDLYDAELKKMFDFPLQFQVNGVFFPINDLSKAKLNDYAQLYDSAYRHYGKAEYKLGNIQLELMDLLWKSLIVKDRSHKSSDVMEVSEAIIIKSKFPSGPIDILLDKGSQEGGHKHYDMGNLLIYFNGNPLLSDYPPPSYGLPAYREWYIRSFAHNTLSIDEMSQPLRLIPASIMTHDLISFGHKLKVVNLDMNQLYKGVDINRKLIVDETNELVVDIVKCTSSTSHTYDLLYHINGNILNVIDDEPKLNIFNKYKYLKQSRKFATKHIIIKQSNQIINLFALGNNVEQYFSKGPTFSLDKLEPVVVQRVKGENSYLINLFSFSTKISNAELVNNNLKMYDANMRLLTQISLKDI